MRRPWNLVNLPVYSLATYHHDGFNMNICTYVSATSLKPKLYTVAVFKGTHTLTLLRKNDIAVLQLLHQCHSRLVNTLGKRHGSQFDKVGYLKKKDMLTTWSGLPVLKNCCALLKLRMIEHFETKGDHELFVCEVKKSKVNVESGILTTQHLINSRILL